MCFTHPASLFENNRQQSCYNLGYTLLELLMAMALVSIILALVVPSTQSFINHSRMRSDINHISALLHFARTTAISKVEDISLCASRNYQDCDNKWQHPLIVFVDKNNNDRLDGDEVLLASKEVLNKQQKLKGPSNSIVFRESGSNASPASLVLCPVDNNAKYARALFVSLQGRVRLSIDTNGDGVHETSKARNINCESF